MCHSCKGLSQLEVFPWSVAIGAGIIVLLVTELDKYFRKNKANN